MRQVATMQYNMMNQIPTKRKSQLKYKDLTDTFKKIQLQDKIMFEVTDARGESEESTGIGLERDIIAMLWKKRHEFCIDGWVIIGNILCRSF